MDPLKRSRTQQLERSRRAPRGSQRLSWLHLLALVAAAVVAARSAAAAVMPADPGSDDFRTTGPESVFDAADFGGVQAFSLPIGPGQGTCPPAALQGFAKCLRLPGGGAVWRVIAAWARVDLVRLANVAEDLSAFGPYQCEPPVFYLQPGPPPPAAPATTASGPSSRGAPAAVAPSRAVFVDSSGRVARGIPLRVHERGGTAFFPVALEACVAAAQEAPAYALRVNGSDYLALLDGGACEAPADAASVLCSVSCCCCCCGGGGGGAGRVGRGDRPSKGRPGQDGSGPGGEGDAFTGEQATPAEGGGGGGEESSDDAGKRLSGRSEASAATVRRLAGAPAPAPSPCSSPPAGPTIPAASVAPKPALASSPAAARWEQAVPAAAPIAQPPLQTASGSDTPVGALLAAAALGSNTPVGALLAAAASGPQASGAAARHRSSRGSGSGSSSSRGRGAAPAPAGSMPATSTARAGAEAGVDGGRARRLAPGRLPATNWVLASVPPPWEDDLVSSHLLRLQEHLSWHSRIGFTGHILYYDRAQTRRLLEDPAFQQLLRSFRVVVVRWAHFPRITWLPWDAQGLRLSHAFLALWGHDAGLLPIDLDEFLLLEDGPGRPVAAMPPSAGLRALLTGCGGGGRAGGVTFERFALYCGEACPSGDESPLWDTRARGGGGGGSGGGTRWRTEWGSPLAAYDLIEAAPHVGSKAWGSTACVFPASVHESRPSGLPGCGFSKARAACGRLAHLINAYHVREAARAPGRALLPFRHPWWPQANFSAHAPGGGPRPAPAKSEL
jgi:hypothetical protein